MEIKKNSRNSYFRMMKEGKYRAIRNIPVGWLLQMLHSTDRSDRRLRICSELIVLLGCVMWMSGLTYKLSFIYILTASFFMVHTLFFLLMGNFWVYMLDSFKFVKNPGISGVINYVTRVNNTFLQDDSIGAILIYGSMCRNQFHGRSDLDLRIVLNKDVSFWGKISAFITSLHLRAYSFFILMPVDFQMVDSMAFLDKQMRHDEHPIIVLQRDGFIVPRAGISFTEVKSNPSLVLRR